MSTPLDGPNPLRPYYIPPSIAQPPGVNISTSSPPFTGSKHVPAPKPSFGSSARDILSDLDYSGYLSDSSPSTPEVIKGLVDQALWKYTSVLLAQPFEVAKTVLQVQLASSVQDGSSQTIIAEDMRRNPSSYRDEIYDIASDESDPDSPSYFTSATPLSHTPSRSPKPHRGRSRVISPPPTSQRHSPHTQRLISKTSITAILSHLWTAEGAWGIWKGTNSTFVHSVLLSTLTTFARSLLCAVFALPDPSPTLQGLSPILTSATGGLDILSSSSPLSSLAAAAGAAGIAGLLLAPLDIARTKLMLTPSTHPPRSLLSALQSLSSWILPLSIAPVTFLHSALPTFISASSPLFLRSNLGIDPVLTPSMYTLATIVSQVFELAVRLPVETVLRRGQMAVVQSRSQSQTSSAASVKPRPLHSESPKLQTTVELGPYQGLVSTMYHIAFEEGERGSEPEIVRGTRGAPALRAGMPRRRKRGQGLEGLFRGYRVGMWGLVGVWGAAVLGGAGGTGGEF